MLLSIARFIVVLGALLGVLSPARSAPTIAFRAQFSVGESTQAMRAALDRYGNVFVIGTTGPKGSFTGQDWFIAKLNKVGKLLWTKKYNGPGNGFDQPSAVAVDGLGNAFVCGYASGSAVQGPIGVLLKYDTNGNLKFTRVMDGPWRTPDGWDDLRGMSVDYLGFVYVTGAIDSSPAAKSNMVIRKYSNTGSLVWSREWSGPGTSFDIAYGMRTAPNGYHYIHGDSGGTAMLWIVTPQGAIVKALRVVGNESPYSTIRGIDVVGDRVVAFGSLRGTRLEADSYDRAFVALYTNLGVLIRLRLWGGISNQVYPYVLASMLLGNGSLASVLVVNRYDAVKRAIRHWSHNSSGVVQTDKAMLESTNYLDPAGAAATPTGAHYETRTYVNGQYRMLEAYFSAAYALAAYYTAASFYADWVGYGYSESFYSFFYYHFYGFAQNAAGQTPPVSHVAVGRSDVAGKQVATVVAFRHDLQVRTAASSVKGTQRVLFTVQQSALAAANEQVKVTVRTAGAAYAGPTTFQVVVPKGQNSATFSLDLKGQAFPQPVVVEVESQSMKTGSTVLVVNPK